MAKLKILMKGSMNVFMVMLIIIALWVLAMVLDNYYDQSMAVTQEMSEHTEDIALCFNLRR